jgi:hypothetical protein
MSLISKFFGGKPEQSPEGAAAGPATPAAVPAAAEPPPPERAELLAAEEARLDAALAHADEAALAQFVVHGGTTRIRQRAAAAIADPERIRELIRSTRGSKDNAVYRILTAKRDARLQSERAAAQVQAELATLAAAVNRHARLPYDPLYEATVIEHERRWQALAAHAAAALQAAVSSDLTAARQVIDAHRAGLAAAARRQQDAADAAARERELAELAAAERAAAALERAAAADAETARLAAERAAEDAQAQAEAESVREVIGLLRQMQAALDRGGSARAARLRDALAKQLDAAADATLPAWFARQLERVDEQLGRLKDWHDFTAAPKRPELIERMRSLIGAEIAPEQLAQHIRKLQQEWRTLHRGAGEDDSAESQRFRELGQQAYEPCKQHFAAQAAQRAANREQREAILAGLAAVSAAQSGEQADWRLVAQTLAAARRDWRRYAPVDQDIAASLQARLKAALDELGGRLDAEYARNVEAKRSLIARAEALLALADVRAAIDAAKGLQRDWKSIGIVPHAKDNALWEEFRRHCNAVFERSAQETAAHALTLTANSERAATLIDGLERIATLEGEPLREGLEGIDAVLEELDGLDLPHTQMRELRQRCQRAVARCREAAEQDRGRAAARSAAALFDAAAAIRAYGFARLAGAAAEQLETLSVAVTAALGEITAAPKPARTTLEKCWAKLNAGAPAAAPTAADAAADAAANAATLRLLCIRAELATERATPPEDVERRREYQLRRLVDSRNLGVDTAPENVDALVVEWLGVGAVDPALEAPLRARFEQCRAAARRSGRERG